MLNALYPDIVPLSQQPEPDVCCQKKGFELMGMLYFISTFHFMLLGVCMCVCMCIQSSSKKAQLLFPDAA